MENNKQHNHEGRQHYHSPEIAATGRGDEDEGAVTPNDGRPFTFGHLLFTFRRTNGFLRAKMRARKDDCDQRRSIVASTFILERAATSEGGHKTSFSLTICITAWRPRSTISGFGEQTLKFKTFLTFEESFGDCFCDRGMGSNCSCLL